MLIVTHMLDDIDSDIDPTCPQVEVLKVELSEESSGQRVSLTVANLPNLDSPPACFYR